ncbi:MAG: zf-HC2 domain-containing protein, partial [Candidatus Eisenbacteria sp.]|nr:zf-HC2 domain-containing protein [Candidatus Eisenbacteria bacterium]
MRSSCGFERYLTAFADGELPEKLNRKVEAHVGRCTACASELDWIRASD